MKRVACIATLCLASSLPVIAGAAPDDLTRSLRGDYAFAGDASCIGSRYGISLTGYRTAPPGHLVSFSVEGIRRYNGDGTGTIFNARAININHEGTSYLPPGLFEIGPASIATFSGTFTYTVGPDHSIHIVQGPLTSTQVVGPNVGSTMVWTGIRIDGHVSEDFKTIVTATPIPDPSNPASIMEIGYQGTVNGPIAEYRICHRSRVMTRISGGNSGAD